MSATHSVHYDIRNEKRKWSVRMQLPLQEHGHQPGGADITPWVRLGFNQCEHCRLSDQACCPIARAIEYYASALEDWVSYDDVVVRVTLNAGLVSEKQTSAQQVLSSILGIIIASESECEHTRVLLPMVYFHRPFATQEESIYRALANMALISRLRGSTEPFSDFVVRKYEAIHQLNVGIVRRIQAIHPEWEALINALINLDTFAKGILFHARHEFTSLENLDLILADDLP